MFIDVISTELSRLHYTLVETSALRLTSNMLCMLCTGSHQCVYIYKILHSAFCACIETSSNNLADSPQTMLSQFLKMISADAKVTGVLKHTNPHTNTMLHKYNVFEQLLRGPFAWADMGGWAVIGRAVCARRFVLGCTSNATQ
jgi:hypothetical protein